MSSEIKNTLFRFVTMRAPELVENSKVKSFFVSHPDDSTDKLALSTSVFINAIAHMATNVNRSTVLNTTATSFKNEAITDVKDLYESSGIIKKRLFDFAIWLTKNRTKFSLTQLEKKLNDINVGTTTQQWATIDEEDVVKLWDNLFYQIVTSKSPYVRDMILSVLVAHFFLTNSEKYESDISLLRKLAQARVIIPKILFTKDEVTSNSRAFNKALENLPLQTKELDKELAVILANEQLVAIQNQIASVKKVKLQYDKTIQKSFVLAQKSYNSSVATLMANAETVDRIFTDPNTDLQKTVTEFVDLDIPKFTFEYPDELNLATLNSKLDATTYSRVENLVQEENLETFDEVLEVLNKQVEEISNFIFENSTVQQGTLVTDGMIVPVTQTTTVRAFSIAGLGSTSNQPLQLLFSDSVANADIVQASYRIIFEDETEISGTTFVDSIVNNKLNVKIFTQGVNLLNKNEFTLLGTFTKATGEVIAIEGVGTVTEYVFGGLSDTSISKILGSTTTYTVKGNGKYSLELIDLGDDNSSNNNNTNATGAVIHPYIPSDYGIKRLGIADYRKVEQEICCYVPGEVSHIENIMAREYKEKSTRRLRRSEDTTTSTKEQEIEKLTDTTSTDRFEMNQEVSAVLSEQTDIGLKANAHWGNGNAYGGSVDGSFANNTSSEDSNSQAVTHAKEVTERALDRVVQKVKEERISKIIEEFEENSKHGFDNTKGDKHVSGVYRWVDKIYKNKVVNYGKRLMFEFMIPKPAHFHGLTSTLKSKTGEALIRPIDPRKATMLPVNSYNDITWASASYWGGVFNVVLEKAPEDNIKSSVFFQKDNLGTSGEDFYNVLGSSYSTDLKVPEKYQATRIKGVINGVKGAATPRVYPSTKITICGIDSISTNITWVSAFHKLDIDLPLNNVRDKIGVSVSNWDIAAISGNFEITCALTPEALKEWQIKTFNAIIIAYELKLEEYNQKMNQLRSEVKGTNPLFFREIENTILRKNCIEYLASHEALGEKPLLINSSSVENFRVDYNNPELETYAAKVKFFEQAFEWNLMSYFFYPFYWADKNKWEELYNINDIDDPTFRAFLRSGMARVIITVRPGFEEVVNWYMTTGQIWNGGQVPAVNDPLFVSIIEELREPEGEVEETWESRVPTSLTVIQAGSIGLNVQGLPCNTECDDNLLFDSDGNPVFDAAGNSLKVFEQTNTMLGGSITNTNTGNESQGAEEEEGYQPL